jgi:hypothetical protein
MMRHRSFTPLNPGFVSVSIRLLIPILASALATQSPAVVGQEWVQKMFSESFHDFGVVPKGSEAIHEFKFVNKYQEDLYVDSVRSSCNCTTAKIKVQEVKTYEEGSIICELNTKSHNGLNTAVITVVFSKPYYGEMQLNVKGNIRSDIDVDPGMIDFGEVDLGMEKSTQATITYSGRNNWQIKDIRSANSNLGVSIERVTLPGKTAYTMNVKLKETAPSGEFLSNIVVVTNESQSNLVAIPVRGTVNPPLVLPVRVNLGTVKVGETGKSFVLARSKTPFEITKIECDDERFVFTKPDGKKDKHVIPLEFKSGDEAGAVRKTVTIHTDLGDAATASTVVVANVAAK